MRSATIGVSENTPRAGTQHEINHYRDSINRGVPASQAFDARSADAYRGTSETNAWSPKLNNRVDPAEYQERAVRALSTYCENARSLSEFASMLTSLREDKNSSNPQRAAIAKEVLDRVQNGTVIPLKDPYP